MPRRFFFRLHSSAVPAGTMFPTGNCSGVSPESKMRPHLNCDRIQFIWL